MDLHSFYIGTAFDAWTYFGAHLKEDGCLFRVYAPAAKDVAVIGAFSDWRPVPAEKDGTGGVWQAEIEGAKAGDMYKYRIYFEGGGYCDHADPYAFSSELRPGTASVIADLDYTYHDAAWMKNRSLGYNDPVNIYEVHLGSWRRRPDGSFYTYSELAPMLAEYVKAHHYTHVELMPLAEYPVDESWGYQVLGFYSATSRYGSPQDLMTLVDTLHQNGIGVIYDFVPVHFALDYYGLSRFDGSALYEYPSGDTGVSEWGSHNFNYYRGEVRSFLQSAADFWIQTYHADGLRMDAISNAIYWQGNRDRGVNEGAITFIKEMNAGLSERYPHVMKIAEDSTNYLKVTAPVRYDGLGFDYKWDMGWMNDTLEFFKTDPMDRGAVIGKLQWSMMYFYNELYLLPFSHDEVVHGKKTILDKMPGSYDEKFAQVRLLYLYMMTHPGKKLNFMGNELGQFSEWSEARELDWMLLDYPAHHELYEYLIALNALYLKTPPLYAQDYNSQDFAWCRTSRLEVLAYERRAGDARVLVVLNFGGHDLKDVQVEYSAPARFEPVFVSQNDMMAAGALETVPSAGLTEAFAGRQAPTYALSADLPPFGGAVFAVSPLRRPEPPAKPAKKTRA